MKVHLYCMASCERVNVLVSACRLKFVTCCQEPGYKLRSIKSRSRRVIAVALVFTSLRLSQRSSNHTVPEQILRLLVHCIIHRVLLYCTSNGTQLFVFKILHESSFTMRVCMGIETVKP